MPLLEGSGGVEAAGGVDLAAAGVFGGVEDETVSADKGRVGNIKQPPAAASLHKFSRFLTQKAYCRTLLHDGRQAAAAAVVLGRLLCREGPSLKKKSGLSESQPGSTEPGDAGRTRLTSLKDPSASSTIVSSQ